MSVLRVLPALLALLLPGPVSAEPEPATKAAAYLLKILPYVEWPPQAFENTSSPIVIGVLGAEDLREALLDIAKTRPAQGRPVVVRSLSPGEAPGGVHMAFVGGGAQPELARLKGTPGVLLVSNAEGALDRGAMVNLVRSGDDLRFEVAPEAALKSGVHLSSRMLSVAQRVQQGAP